MSNCEIRKAALRATCQLADSHPMWEELIEVGCPLALPYCTLGVPAFGCEVLPFSIIPTSRFELPDNRHTS